MDGRRFVKYGKPGFLKLHAMKGNNRNRYELQFMNRYTTETEFADADEAFELSVEGAKYESEQKERMKQRMPC